MNQESIPLDDFKKYLPADTAILAHEIWQEMHPLYNSWGCFCALFRESKETIDLLNESGGYFFCLVQQLLLQDVFIKISSLTGAAEFGNRTNISILALAASLKSIDLPGPARVLEAFIESTSEQVGVIRRIRNRILVHSDLEENLILRAEGLPEIEIELIEAVINGMQKAFNEFETSIGRGVTAFSFSRGFARAEDVLFRLSVAKKRIDEDRPAN